MKFKRVARVKEIGTSLQGYVDASYQKLVRLFGKPLKGDGYKVDAEWVLQGPGSTIITIYNYKDGKNYLGPKGLPVSKIRRWHVGGKSSRALKLVKEVLVK